MTTKTIGKGIAVFAAAMLATTPAFAQRAGGDGATQPQTVLFIGNSFTFGAHSAALRYRAETIADLNGDGIGGVPALFKLFTEEAGLDYRVSAETSPGKTLEWHWQHKRNVVDHAWDHVVMQEYSVLDRDDPGNPAKLLEYSAKFAQMFADENKHVDVSLTATWTRPDQTYKPDGHWYGKSVYQMARDLRRSYDRAAENSSAIDHVNPVGQAFNCAIKAGFADPDPYDGITFGQLDLWTYDHYHAGVAGYYLEALTVFIGITGKDPRAFGQSERAASELGLSPRQATRLQRVAWANIHDESCESLAK
ncbi:DUF4886 domain-containing protein [Stakelama saccharophila]|uniref:PEP-CTERM sorting domain-containing protein n=1 Tax=Stakelama saccharophila TaxID=3075605 RepID=A0ABZ0B889_9SPHN|nr:DUF4886 domain-containing protein [Stakelama sp. W311]WNO53631.1 PEP-CTERM sorting domain-containing protein [Stakelama sp. W311]